MRRMDERQEGGAKDTKSAVLRNGGLDAGCDRVRGSVVIGHMGVPELRSGRAFRWNVPDQGATRVGPALLQIGNGATAGGRDEAGLALLGSAEAVAPGCFARHAGEA